VPYEGFPNFVDRHGLNRARSTGWGDFIVKEGEIRANGTKARIQARR